MAGLAARDDQGDVGEPFTFVGMAAWREVVIGDRPGYVPKPLVVDDAELFKASKWRL